MSNEHKLPDTEKGRGIAGTILHAKIPPAGITFLETLLVLASLFLAVRSLIEIVRKDAAQWADPTVIASIIVAVVSTALYLDARFPGESRKHMWKRVGIVGCATLGSCLLALSY